MNNKVDLSKEEIKQLLYKRLLGTLSLEEEKRLTDWEESHPSNRKLAQTTSSFPFLEKSVMDASHREAEASWDALRHRIGYHTFYRSRRFYASVAAAVAVVCLLLAGSYYWFVNTNSNQLCAGTEKAFVYLVNGERVEMNDHMRYELYMQNIKANRQKKEISSNLYHSVVTPRGNEYSLILDDGSRIHLNAMSSLTVPADFSAKKRSVNFVGEAYFDIASDAKHPFCVQTGKAEIKVLGTRFCVRNYDEDAALAVTLEEGKVEINSAYQLVQLVPGEQALVYDDGRIEKRSVDTYLYCAWNRQRIVYDNEPLEEILTDLGRWYNFDAAYSSDRLREMRLSMDIEKPNDFKEVAKLFERLGKIQIKTKKNKVIVREL